MQWEEYVVKIVQCEIFWNLFENSAIAKQCYVGRCNARTYCSWWEIGNEVYAMTEYKDGQQVDPHNIIAIGSKLI